MTMKKAIVSESNAGQKPAAVSSVRHNHYGKNYLLNCVSSSLLANKTVAVPGCLAIFFFLIFLSLLLLLLAGLGTRTGV